MGGAVCKKSRLKTEFKISAIVTCKIEVLYLSCVNICVGWNKKESQYALFYDF